VRRHCRPFGQVEAVALINQWITSDLAVDAAIAQRENERSRLKATPMAARLRPLAEVAERLE
jgi:hypothetical protein